MVRLGAAQALFTPVRARVHVQARNTASCVQEVMTAIVRDAEQAGLGIYAYQVFVRGHDDQASFTLRVDRAAQVDDAPVIKSRL